MDAIILADKLAVGQAVVSMAVAMEDRNAVEVEATVFNKTSSVTLDIALEGSNDLENWTTSDIETEGTLSWAGITTGFQTNRYSGIAYQYASLRYDLDDSDVVCIVASELRRSVF